jgi:hypothetical protein
MKEAVSYMKTDHENNYLESPLTTKVRVLI